MLTSRLLIFISLFWASLGQSLAQDQNSVGETKVGVQELSGSSDVQPMTMKELIDQTKKFEELLAKGLNEGADNQTTLEPVELDFNEDIFPTKKRKMSQPESEPFKLVLKNSLRDARKSKECGRMTISYTLLPTSWTNHIQCSANDFTTKTKGWWDSGSLFTQNYDTSASGNVSSISFDLRYEIDGDSFTESVKLDPKSNESHITVFGRGKATKYVFKIISMTSPEAKIPNKKSQWQVFAEARLSELEKPTEQALESILSSGWRKAGGLSCDKFVLRFSKTRGMETKLSNPQSTEHFEISGNYQTSINRITVSQEIRIKQGSNWLNGLFRQKGKYPLYQSAKWKFEVINANKLSFEQTGFALDLIEFRKSGSIKMQKISETGEWIKCR